MINKVINKIKFKIAFKYLHQSSQLLSDLFSEKITFMLLYDHDTLKECVDANELKILESFFNVSFHEFSESLYKNIQEKLNDLKIDSDDFYVSVDLINNSYSLYELRHFLKNIKPENFEKITKEDIVFLKEKECLEFFKYDHINPLDYYHLTKNSSVLYVFHQIKEEDKQYIIEDLFKNKIVDVYILEKMGLMSLDDLKKNYEKDSEYFLRLFALTSSKIKIIIKEKETFEWLINILPEKFLFNTNTIFDYEGENKKEILIKNLKDKRINWEYLPFKMKRFLNPMEILQHFDVVISDLLKPDYYHMFQEDIKKLLKEKNIKKIFLDFGLIEDEVLSDIIKDEDILIKMLKGFKEISDFNPTLLKKYVNYLDERKKEILEILQEKDDFTKIENLLKFKIVSEDKKIEDFHIKILSYLSQSEEMINLDLFNNLFNEIIEKPKNIKDLDEKFSKINSKKIFSENIMKQSFFSENFDFIIDYMTSKFKNNQWKDIEEDLWKKEIIKFKKIGIFLPFVESTNYTYCEDVYNFYTHLIQIDQLKTDSILLTLHEMHKNKLNPKELNIWVEKILKDLNIDFFDKYLITECPELVYEKCLDMKRNNNQQKESYILQMIKYGNFEQERNVEGLEEFKKNLDYYLKIQKNSSLKKIDINMSEGFPLTIGNNRFNGLFSEHFYAIFDCSFDEIVQNIQDKKWSELKKNIDIEQFNKHIDELVAHTVEGKEFFNFLIQDFKLNEKNHVLWSKMNDILRKLDASYLNKTIEKIYIQSIDHIEKCQWLEDEHGFTEKNIGVYIQKQYNCDKISKDVLSKIDFLEESTFYIELLSTHDRKKVLQKLIETEPLYKIIDIFRFSNIKKDFLECVPDDMFVKWFEQHPVNFSRLLTEIKDASHQIRMKDLEILKESIDKITDTKFVHILANDNLEEMLHILIEKYPTDMMNTKIFKSYNPSMMKILNKNDSFFVYHSNENNLKRDLNSHEQNRLIHHWVKEIKNKKLDLNQDVLLGTSFNAMSVDFLSEYLCREIKEDIILKIKEKILEEFPQDIHYFIFTSQLKEKLPHNLDIMKYEYDKQQLFNGIIDHEKILKGYQDYLSITKDNQNQFAIFLDSTFKPYENEINEILLKHHPIVYLKKSNILENEKLTKFNQYASNIDLYHFYHSAKNKNMINHRVNTIFEAFMNHVIDKKDYNLLNKIYVDLKQKKLKSSFFALSSEDSINYELMAKSLLDNFLIYNHLIKHQEVEKISVIKKKI